MAEQNEHLGVKFTADIKPLMDALARMTNELGKTEQKFNEAGSNINGAFDKANVTINIFNQELKKAEKTAEESSGSFGKLGNTIASLFAINQVKAWTQAIFDTRKEIQIMEVAFETLVGNKEKATDLFESIKTFAVSTPMEMPTLAKGAQTLLSFGFAAEEIMPILKQIGDISMGDADKFNSLILSFSQMSSAGKVLGQDLMQMIGAGFNPLSEIARTTGKSLAQVKEELEKGSITVKDVQNAYKTATSEGGKYNGMLEAQSKTLKGAWSNLMGAISDMQNDLGKQMEDTFATAIDVATSLVKNYEKIASIIKVVATAYGTYKAAVMAIRAAEKVNQIINLYQQYGKLTEALKKTAAAQKMLNNVSKISVGAFGVAAVAAAVMAWREYNNQLKEAAERQAELNKEKKLQKDLDTQNFVGEINLIDADNQIKSIELAAGTAEEKIKRVNDQVSQLIKNERELLHENGVRDPLYRIGSGSISDFIGGSELNVKLVSKWIKEDLISAYTKAGDANELATKKAEDFVNVLLKYRKAAENLKYTGSAISTSVDDDFATQEANIKKMLEVITDTEKTLSERSAMLERLLKYDKDTEATKWIENDDVKKAIKALNKDIKKEAEDAKKRRIASILAIEEFARAEQKAIRDAALESQRLNTELRHDSLGKELRLIEIEKEQTINAINDAREAKLEALRKNAYNEYIVNQKGYTKLSYDEWKQSGRGNAVKLDEKNAAMFETQLLDAGSTFDAKTKEALKKYKEIAKEAAKEIQATFASDLERTQVEIQEKYKNLIEQLIISGQNDASLFAKAINARDKELVDASYQKKLEVFDLIVEKRKAELEIQKESKKITEDQYNQMLAQIEKDQLDEQIKALEDLIAKSIKLGSSSEEVEELNLQLEILRKKAEKAGIALGNATGQASTNKWKKLADGIRMVAGEFNNLDNKTGEISSAFGMMFANITEGYSKFKEEGKDYKASMEDYANAATTAVGTAIQFYNAVKEQKKANKDVKDAFKIAEEEARHQAALSRIAQYEYTKNNILQNEDIYGKATASIEKYKQAQKELQQYTKTLGSGRVQVGTATSRDAADIATKTLTGAAAGASIGSIVPGLGTAIGAVVGAAAGALVSVFGSSKQVYAVYQDLQSKYGKIYDNETYELNQAILDDYDKMDDATRHMVDNWGEIKDAMTEARQQLEETITDLVGDISDNLSESLVNGFINGNTMEAVDDFRKYIASKLKELYMNNIMTTVFNKQFESLAEAMQKSMDVNGGGDGSWIDDLSKVMDNIPNLVSVAGDFMQQAEEEAKKRGFDLFGKEGSSQNALKGTVASMTEDTASELNGNFLGLKLTAMEINTNVAAANDILNSSLAVQRQIASNTAFCERLVAIEEAVSHLDRVGINVL